MPRPRSPRPSHRAATRLPLDRMVADIDAALGSAEPGSLLRVTADPLRVGHLPLQHEHPLEALLGFTAPPGWLAIGVHCEGWAHRLDAGDPVPAGSSPGPDGADEPTSVVVTTLVDRTGAGAGLLRQGASVTRFDDAPEGIVGDACRRALGLPTPPPPSTTLGLWLRLWLDRVVEALVFAEPHPPTTWEAMVELHPAAAHAEVGSPADGLSRLTDPDAVAEATRALAELMPWSRLRRDPEAIPLTGPPPSPELAAWMDDGMFARVVLDDLTPLPLLAKTLVALLPWPLVHELYEAVALAHGSSRCNGWVPRPEEVAQ